jgi:hypothetical protein
MRIVLAPLLLMSLLGTATAGSDDRECKTADGTIVMTGNGRITIDYTDSAKKKQRHDGPVSLMPNYGSIATAGTLIAVPIGRDKIVSKSHQTAHITHKDGSKCTGRERWDDKSVQRYVVMGKDGAALGFLFDGTVTGKTTDGYIVTDFTCRSWGVTSAGGCRPEEGEEIVWK